MEPSVSIDPLRTSASEEAITDEVGNNGAENGAAVVTAPLPATTGASSAAPPTVVGELLASTGSTDDNCTASPHTTDPRSGIVQVLSTATPAGGASTAPEIAPPAATATAAAGTVVASDATGPVTVAVAGLVGGQDEGSSAVSTGNNSRSGVVPPEIANETCMPLPTSHRAPVVFRRVAATGKNLFVNGLGPDIDDIQLMKMFEKFGKILSTRVLANMHTGHSKGMGFVHFEDQNAIPQAIAEMNNRVSPEGYVLHVKLADEDATFIPEETNKLFVRNIPEPVTTAILWDFFQTYGNVLDCSLHKDISARGLSEHTSDHMAYVTYASISEATTACHKTHGAKPFPNQRKALFVKPAETLHCRNLRLKKMQQQQQMAQQQQQQQRLPPPGGPWGPIAGHNHHSHHHHQGHHHHHHHHMQYAPPHHHQQHHHGAFHHHQQQHHAGVFHHQQQLVQPQAHATPGPGGGVAGGPPPYPGTQTAVVGGGGGGAPFHPLAPPQHHVHQQHQHHLVHQQQPISGGIVGGAGGLLPPPPQAMQHQMHHNGGGGLLPAPGVVNGPPMFFHANTSSGAPSPNNASHSAGGSGVVPMGGSGSTGADSTPGGGLGGQQILLVTNSNSQSVSLGGAVSGGGNLVILRDGRVVQVTEVGNTSQPAVAASAFQQPAPTLLAQQQLQGQGGPLGPGGSPYSSLIGPGTGGESPGTSSSSSHAHSKGSGHQQQVPIHGFHFPVTGAALSNSNGASAGGEAGGEPQQVFVVMPQ